MGIYSLHWLALVYKGFIKQLAYKYKELMLQSTLVSLDQYINISPYNGGYLGENNSNDYFQQV